MNYTMKDLQARVNALGFVKTPLTVDGYDGPNTRKAVAGTMSALGIRKQHKLFHEAGLQRCIWHWAASTYTVNASVTDHYNDVFDYQGGSHDGAARAEDQARYDWRKGIGVSHTRNLNTSSIGLSVAAMHGAKESPFNFGKYPLTWPAINAMLDRTAHYCHVFDIPVSPWTTLTHAEVQGTLGVKQKWKWDYKVLPDFKKTRSPREVGDILREMLKERM